MTMKEVQEKKVALEMEIQELDKMLDNSYLSAIEKLKEPFSFWYPDNEGGMNCYIEKDNKKIMRNSADLYISLDTLLINIVDGNIKI